MVRGATKETGKERQVREEWSPSAQACEPDEGGHQADGAGRGAESGSLHAPQRHGSTRDLTTHSFGWQCSQHETVMDSRKQRLKPQDVTTTHPKKKGMK